MQWQRGHSGNPRGRPPNASRLDVRALARQHGSAAFEKLVAFMDHADPRVAVRACEAVLDRAYGKPGPELLQAAEQHGFTVVLRQYVLGAPGPVPPTPVAPVIDGEPIGAGEPLARAEAAPVRVRVKHFPELPPRDATG